MSKAGKKPKKKQEKKTRTANTFSRPNRRFIRFALAAVLIFTIGSYSNIFNNELTNWDDDRYVNKNQYIREFSAKNLKAIFWGEASDYMGNYHPLTMLSLAVDFHLSHTKKVDKDIQYEVDATIFHLTNLLLHLITTLLVFFSLLHLLNHLQTKRSGEIALIAAILFGVHTMHVESVTWVAERKDVLYSAFFFASLLTYQHYAQKRRRKFLLYSMLLFILSLLSKGQAVSLALVLPAVDLLYNRRLKDRQVILEKLPYFALALVLGIIAVQAQEGTEAIHKDEEFTLLERFVYASYGFTMYLLKLVWPFGLSAIYPYPYSSGHIPAQYYLALLVPALYILLLLRMLRRRTLIAFGLYFFAANIVFVLQILPVGNSVMADRYVYIPSAGFFFIIGLLYAGLIKTRASLMRPLQIALAAYMVALGVKTFQRNEVWENSLALWNDVIKKQTTATVAYNNRGSVHRKKDNFKKALRDFSHAIYLDSTYAHAYYNRGTTKKDWAKELGDNKLYKKAIPDFKKAIKYKTPFPEAYHNRGLCYDNLGRYDRALRDFNKAISQNINDYKIYVNRGVLKGKKGNMDGAIKDFKRALKMAPNQPDALSNMGLAYSHKKQYKKALPYYTRAIKANPEFENAYYNRGILYYRLNKYQKAITDFTTALRLNAQNAMTYYQRALAYMAIDRQKQACNDLRQAIQLGYKPAKSVFAKTCGN